MDKIRAVIFDLDGTIGDTLPLCIKAFKQSIEPLIDRELSDAEIIATFGPSEEGTIMALAPDDYEKGVADYLRHYEKLHDMCPAPFPGIRTLLDTLRQRNVRLALVTGKGKYSTAISLDDFGLADSFEIIETGVSTGPSKPAGIKNVLRAFSEIPQASFIYVGDAPSDIAACRAVGIPVVGAAWASTTDENALQKLHPDALFSSIADFSTWLMTRV